MNDQKFYITTALPYMNATLHIGHAYEFVLADVIARYHRTIGDSTFFLTGSDEHGDKIVRAAQKENLGPQAFVNNKVEEFKILLSKLDISNDEFIRTSDREKHWPGANKVWLALEKAGDIYKGTYKGLYCSGCEAFITEKELVNGKCVHHDSAPEYIEEENYFFRLSKYGHEIKRLIECEEIKITPRARANEIISLITSLGGENDLGDVSISRPERSIPWGIPVPNDPTQLMYVWCDALSNYISALGYGSPDEKNFEKFWPADMQIVGKDIVRFHALLWPAILLSLKLPLPRELFVHGFITSNGKKMSKSIGNVIAADDFIREYSADAVRYYFTREVSPTEDGDISHEKFKEAYNANLANGLGNLVSRTLKMADQYFGGTVSGSASDAPALRSKVAAMGDVDDLAGANVPYVVINDILPRYHRHMKSHEINKAVDVVWELIAHLDQLVADYEPFKLVKTDKDKAEAVIWSLLYGLHEVRQILEPIMPKTAERIADLVTVVDRKEGELVFTTKALPEPLFMRK